MLRVFGGIEETIWPWLFKIEITDDEKKYICAANLLTSGILITAAHCCDSITKITHMTTGYDVEFEGYFKHPEYDDSFRNDICVVKEMFVL